MKYQYVVEGRGEFPRDMLRYDSSEPVSEADRMLTEAKLGDELLLLESKHKHRTYTVTLQTSSQASPHTKRWESFGFRVIEVGPGLWGEVSAPSRGRPRVHAEGTSASERAQMSDFLLEQAGGKKRTIRFSPEAVAALEAIRAATGEASDTVVVERVLVEECRRISEEKDGNTPTEKDIELLREIERTGDDEQLWFWQRRRLLALGLYERQSVAGVGYIGWKAKLTDVGRKAISRLDPKANVLTWTGLLRE